MKILVQKKTLQILQKVIKLGKGLKSTIIMVQIKDPGCCPTDDGATDDTTDWFPDTFTASGTLAVAGGARVVLPLFT